MAVTCSMSGIGRCGGVCDATRKLTDLASSEHATSMDYFCIIEQIAAVLYVLKCSRMAVTCSTSSSGRCGGVCDAANLQVDLASSEHATAMD